MLGLVWLCFLLLFAVFLPHYLRPVVQACRQVGALFVGLFFGLFVGFFGAQCEELRLCRGLHLFPPALCIALVGGR